MFLKNKKYLFFIYLFVVFVLASIVFFKKDSFQQEDSPSVLPTPNIFSPHPTPTPTPQGKGRGFETEDFLQEQRESIRNTPILQKLPAESPFFSIEYINETHLIVYAETPDKERGYNEARKWFGQNGIDINSLIIEYK